MRQYLDSAADKWAQQYTDRLVTNGLLTVNHADRIMLAEACWQNHQCIPLPSGFVTLSWVMILSVFYLYLARSSSGLCSYAEGLRLAFASKSSPLLIRSLPGLMFACARRMLCYNRSHWSWLVHMARANRFVGDRDAALR